MWPIVPSLAHIIKWWSFLLFTIFSKEVLRNLRKSDFLNTYGRSCSWISEASNEVLVLMFSFAETKIRSPALRSESLIVSGFGGNRGVLVLGSIANGAKGLDFVIFVSLEIVTVLISFFGSTPGRILSLGEIISRKIVLPSMDLISPETKNISAGGWGTKKSIALFNSSIFIRLSLLPCSSPGRVPCLSPK